MSAYDHAKENLHKAEMMMSIAPDRQLYWRVEKLLESRTTDRS
jgi:hypothetical protein